MHFDPTYLTEFGRSLMQFALNHPTETITWGLVALAGGRISYVTVAKFVGRNQAKVTKAVAELVKVMKEAALELTTIPTDDPVRQLTDLHELLLRSSEETPRSFWGKLGLGFANLIPGSRSRRAKKRFDQGIRDLLSQWKHNPTAPKSELSRTLVESVVGPIGDYINEGATNSQVVSAASKRYEATSRRRRSKATNIASALFFISTQAAGLVQRAKSLKSDQDAALAAISDRKVLPDLLKLAQSKQLPELLRLMDSGLTIDDIVTLVKNAKPLVELVKGGVAKGLGRLEQLNPLPVKA